MPSSLNTDQTDRKELHRQIRRQTQTWLREGASSADLAFGLTFIAAEMSFQLAPNPIRAIAVMLGVISKTASAHEARSRNRDPDCVVRPIRAREVH